VLPCGPASCPDAPAPRISTGQAEQCFGLSPNLAIDGSLDRRTVASGPSHAGRRPPPPHAHGQEA